MIVLISPTDSFMKHLSALRNGRDANTAAEWRLPMGRGPLETTIATSSGPKLSTRPFIQDNNRKTALLPARAQSGPLSCHGAECLCAE